MNCPCKGCVKPKRHIGCHDHCEEYLKFKGEKEQENKARREYSEGAHLNFDYNCMAKI